MLPKRGESAYAFIERGARFAIGAYDQTPVNGTDAPLLILKEPKADEPAVFPAVEPVQWTIVFPPAGTVFVAPSVPD